MIKCKKLKNISIVSTVSNGGAEASTSNTALK